jgi:hypothetical protein
MLKFVAAAAVAALLAAPAAQAAVTVAHAPAVKPAKEKVAVTSAKFRWNAFRAPTSKTLPRTVPAGFKHN